MGLDPFPPFSRNTIYSSKKKKKSIQTFLACRDISQINGKLFWSILQNKSRNNGIPKVCNLSNNNAMKQNKRNRYERNISNKFLFGKRISKKIFLLKEIDMKRW